MKEVIYIAGDGRSGSTLLDMILSNIENSVSIGEGYRFWKRFYEADTYCGCSEPIEECHLWNEVNKRLKEVTPNYDPKLTWQRIQCLLKFKNIDNPLNCLTVEELKEMSVVIRCFYNSISEISGKEVIVDSSKSVGWLYLMKEVFPSELKIIHLERELPAVANSWKKKLSLPEYREKKVMMPTRSNMTSLKTFIKILLLMKPIRRAANYYFLRYEKLQADPENVLLELNRFLGHSIPISNLKVYPSHSIGGNPMRSVNSSEIVIRKKKEKLQQLNIFEQLLFKSIYLLSNPLR